MIVKINGTTAAIYNVTATYGSIDQSHLTPHSGIDLAMPVGTDIFSPASGYVHLVDYGDKNIGKGILLKLEDGQQLVLGHLSKFNVRDGQYVNVGQKLAESGNTGNSDGAHLHLGLIDQHGNFADPSYYEKTFQDISTFHHQLGSFYTQHVPVSSTPAITSASSGDMDMGFVESVKAIGAFFKDLHNEGVFYAVFHKHLGEVVVDCIKATLRFIFLDYNDATMFIPALLFFLLTCMIGRNRTTKWIVPLIFLFFVTQCIKYSHILD